MKSMTLKTTVLTLAVTILAAGLLIGPDADAGLLDKLTKNSSRDKDPAPRYDRYPTMTFHVGELTRGAVNSWKLGDYDLQLTGGCAVGASGGEEGMLLEGAHAVVTGSVVGETLVAFRVTVLSPNWDQGPENPEIQIEWSEADPTVGVGTGTAPH